MTAITSAPCSAAAFACSTSSWMLPVATITYFQGAPSNDPTCRARLRCFRSSMRACSSRTAAGPGAGDPHQPQDGALDRHRRMPVYEGLHAHGGAAGELARPGDFLSVDEELRHGKGVRLSQGSAFGKAGATRGR